MNTRTLHSQNSGSIQTYKSQSPQSWKDAVLFVSIIATVLLSRQVRRDDNDIDAFFVETIFTFCADSVGFDLERADLWIGSSWQSISRTSHLSEVNLQIQKVAWVIIHLIIVALVALVVFVFLCCAWISDCLVLRRSADYGSPQTRMRVYILFARKDLLGYFFLNSS